MRTPRIIYTDAVFFIRAIANAPTGDMSDRAFDIVQEFKKSTENGVRQSLQTIACQYTLTFEDFADPKYCEAMSIAGTILSSLASDSMNAAKQDEAA